MTCIIRVFTLKRQEDGIQSTVERVKTREKILQTSLDLFNEQGERAVTTNHIAAAMGISTGNLYYHFRNKREIISELFRAYENRVRGVLNLPRERSAQITDMQFYLTEIFRGLWEYRFLHRDLETLLKADAQLHEDYRNFYRYCLAQAQTILVALDQAGIIRADRETCEDLALNAWVMITSWFSFLHCTQPLTPEGGISEAMLEGGIYQVLSLGKPYLTETYREAALALIAEVTTRPDWLDGRMT